MAPPPPSASYLWKFDDDDDTDDSDDSDPPNEYEKDDSDSRTTSNVLRRDDVVEGTINHHSTTGSRNDESRSSATPSRSTSHTQVTSGEDDRIHTHLRRHTNNHNNSHNSHNKPTTTIATSHLAVANDIPSVTAMILETTQTNFSISARLAEKYNITTTTTTTTTTMKDVKMETIHDLHSMDDDNDDDDDDPDRASGNATVFHTNQKKRKKGKKKRHKKVPPSTSSMSPNTTLADITPAITTTHSSTIPRQHVTFQGVIVVTFDRCLGVDVVPTHGGWPLGMQYDDDSTTNNNNNNSTAHDTNHKTTEHHHHQYVYYSIDEYETEKYERLLQRYHTFQSIAESQNQAKDSGIVNNNNNNNNNNSGDNAKKSNKKGIIQSTNPTSSPNDNNNNNNNNNHQLTLETRQWDYKNKQKNPLFGILHESDRMNLLLSSCGPPPSETNTNTTTTVTQPGNHPSSSGRTGNHNNNHHHHGKRNKSTARTRSNGSLSGSKSSTFHHGVTTTGGGERFNHIYTSTNVHAVRNALEQIRIHRTTGIGCNCRQLQVPLVSTTSSSSSSSSSTTNTSNHHNKKSHHHGPGSGSNNNSNNNSNNKRMKLQKLKDELIKRNLLSSDNTSMTREEMEQLLHDTVETEPCCLYTDTCFCARNGIGCQADVCTCWHSSSRSKSGAHKSSSAITVQEIQQRCGNHVGGMYVVDDHKIDSFRNDYLNRLKLCPFITLE